MFQKLGIQLHTISTSILYMILIYFFIKSWMAMMDEQSAFEETIIENERKLPSFTLCPMPYGANKSIESFEDVASAMKNVESNFTIEYYDYDPNIFPSPAPMVQNYNKTLDSNWYFVPKIDIISPSLTTICLIWTPSKDRKLERLIKVLFSSCGWVVRDFESKAKTRWNFQFQ